MAVCIKVEGDSCLVVRLQQRALSSTLLELFYDVLQGSDFLTLIGFRSVVLDQLDARSVY